MSMRTKYLETLKVSVFFPETLSSAAVAILNGMMFHAGLPVLFNRKKKINTSWNIFYCLQHTIVMRVMHRFLLPCSRYENLLFPELELKGESNTKYSIEKME